MASRQAIESRIEGLEEARAALERLLRAEASAIDDTLEVVGQEWVSAIQRKAPELTGRLRRSYTWETGRDGGRRYVEVSSNVHYAPYQEFGTRNINGTPHVRPATREIIGRAPELIAAGIARKAASFASSVGGASATGRIGRAITRLGALGG